MLKEWIAASLPLPQPVVLGLLGLGCFLGTCMVVRRPLTCGWALVPGLVLGVLIEAWQIWDHYSPNGFGGTSVVGVVARHLVDVAVMNLPAVAVLAIARWRRAGS